MRMGQGFGARRFGSIEFRRCGRSWVGLADAWELTAITRVINGGTSGLSERISLANAAYKWLS